MKKILAMLLAVIMTASLFAMTASAETVVAEKTDSLTDEFSDIKAGAWYYDAVEDVVNAGLMKGSNGKFNPGSAMTRAELVTVFARMAGVDDRTLSGYALSASILFRKDVKMNQWFAGAIGWAADCGLVGGVGDKKFEPNRAVNRAEMAKLFVGFMEYMQYEVVDAVPLADSFSDTDKFQAWSVEYIEKFRLLGFAGGDNGKFNPQGKSTRAQIATVLSRYLHANIKAPDPMYPAMSNFLDRYCCATHGMVGVTMGYTADCTLENLANILLEYYLFLDPETYEVVFTEDSEFEECVESYAGQGVGFGENCFLSFLVKNKVTGEQTEELVDVRFDLQKWPDALGFRYCPEDEIMFDVMKDLQKKVESSKYELTVGYDIDKTLTDCFAESILIAEGLRPGIYYVRFENEEGLEDALRASFENGAPFDLSVTFCFENYLQTKCNRMAADVEEGLEKLTSTVTINGFELSWIS